MATSTNTANERLPLSEILKRAEFQTLTPKQQAFVAKFIATGLSTGTYDALGAVCSAYNTQPKNAVILSYQLQGNRKIKKVLDLHFGRTELDSLMSDLARAIRRSIRRDNKSGGLSIATVRAMDFFEKHSGQKVKGSRGSEVSAAEAKAAKRPIKFKVGDIVLVDGVQHRVTVVDQNGKATEADAI